ncbi:MAG: PEP/pyruvate-binding domain-containing protein [Pirellulales bacterium]
MTDEASPRVFGFWPGGSDGDPARKDLLGGKGANLAALSRAGFPVPPGFTISIPTCEQVLRDGHWPAGLEKEIRRAIDRLQTITGRRLGDVEQRLRVAVRSGAERSMPGMLDTLLDRGRSDAAWEDLRQAIDAVFHSWNNPRAVAYRRRHALEELRGTAVTVQAMFPAEWSGVMFTANPQTPAADEFVIEAARGTGDALVSGRTTPDQYILDSRTFALRRVVPGEASGPSNRVRDHESPPLATAQFVMLCELGRRISDHFGGPCDIEWAWGQGQIAILQARPIVGLGPPATNDAFRLAECNRLRTLAGDEPAVWVVHNLAESLPLATPLTAELMQYMLSPGGGLGRLYRNLGFLAPTAGASILEFIGGRPYVDPRRLAPLFVGDLPLAYSIDALAGDPQLLDAPPSQIQWEKASPFFLLQAAPVFASLVRASRRQSRLAADAPARFQRFLSQRLEPFLSERRLRASSLSTLNDAALVDEWSRRKRFVLDELAAEWLLPGYLAGLAVGRLTKRLTQYLGAEHGLEIALRLVSGLEEPTSLAATNSEPLGSLELRDPPSVSSSTGSCTERRAAQKQRRLESEAALADLLAEHGAASLWESVCDDLKSAQRLLPYREIGKSHFLRGYETLREVAHALSRRSGLGDDFFLLRESEWAGASIDFAKLKDASAVTCSERRSQYEAFRRLDWPDVIDSRHLDLTVVPTRAEASATPTRDTAAEGWPARPLSAGVAEGRVRIAASPQDVECELADDELLVCPSTDPSWLPILLQAHGLIVERGGLLSHGALLARELALPAVALPDATKRLRTGDVVKLDACLGRVTRRDGGQP